MLEKPAPRPLDIALHFTPDLCGVSHIPAKADLPVLAGGYAPYEMLISALGACFFHTFQELADKMNLSYDHLDLQIHAERKADPPQTLRSVQMDVKIYGAKAPREKFERAMELTEKYCSVRATVAKVASVESRLSYEDA